MNRSCYRAADGAAKRRFASLDEAERHINGGPGMNAYHCPRCGWYHVGHLPGTKFGSKPNRS